MVRRTPPPDDPDGVHEEMLRHLEDHPPPRRERPAPAPAKPPVRPAPPPIPQLMLRKLRLATAMERLARFVTLHQRQGTPEVLVVVGKGRGSPDGEPVIAPAAREWCQRRPDLVLSVQEGRAEQGGHGALRVRLRPPSG